MPHSSGGRLDGLLARGLRHIGLMVVGGLLVGIGLSASDRLAAGRALGHDSSPADVEIGHLTAKIDELKGRLLITDLKVERLTTVGQYSTIYRIPADLAGRIYDAEEGHALGLSHYVVEPGAGLARAIELATRIAGNEAMTNFAVMHALPRIAEQDPASGYLMESLMAAIASGDPQAQQRLQDFLQKRAPKTLHARRRPT